MGLMGWCDMAAGVAVTGLFPNIVVYSRPVVPSRKYLVCFRAPRVSRGWIIMV
jgi:hypothetical protein